MCGEEPSLSDSDQATADATPEPSAPDPAPRCEFAIGVRPLPVPVIVQLAGRRMPLSTILQWGRGTIVEFNKPVDSDLDLLVSNRRIARGEAVKVGEKFGLRITAVG